MQLIFLHFASVSFLICISSLSTTQESKVFVYKVFFVNYESQERNAQIIKGCKLTNYQSQADCKVFIVNYESQADIKIMRKNFPTT